MVSNPKAIRVNSFLNVEYGGQAMEIRLCDLRFRFG